MDAPRRTIALLAALVLLAPGCTSSPWWWGHKSHGRTDPAAADTSLDRSAAKRSTEADELESLTAELRRQGTLDPETERQLVADLKQTDPSLRRPLVECLRAALASQHRGERPAQAPADERYAPPAQGIAASGPARSAEAAPPSRQEAAGGPSPKESKEHEQASAAQARPDAHERPKDDPGRAPPALPGKPGPPAQAGARQPDGSVAAAGYEASGDRAWQDRLATAIRAMESETGAAPKSESEVARQVCLRLLYLAAGRRDDALQPIPSVPPETQEFWATELYGLECWLNARRTADPVDRAAEAKRSLDEAASKLGESAPLVVRGLAFATEIQSFGCYTRFAKDEFAPEQEVLLYAEVENFKSERTAKGFHTSLRSSYKIFDGAGRQVAEHEFSVIEEVCQSRRRDFFMGYHIRVPRRVFSGRHTLKLTIEDLQKGRIGQGSMDFTVKLPKE